MITKIIRLKIAGYELPEYLYIKLLYKGKYKLIEI